MQPGQLLRDRYQIEKPLAAGGYGQTFLAIDNDSPSKVQVVVKLLKPQNNDPANLQVAKRLFKQEAEILERLGKDNPRIPTLYAYFELKDKFDKVEFYLVQEYIKGKTLTEELQAPKLSESDTLAILKEILTGLITVHPHAIHRDLKPDNIIRRAKDQKLVLIDFGAVKQVRAGTMTTPNPVVSQTIAIGTPGYAPTEQSLGNPKLASDIYAVGAIGIQCLTGVAPHNLLKEEGDSLVLEWQHLCCINPYFAIVLDKMLAPGYRQRYADATEALRAIESLPITPAPPRKSTIPAVELPLQTPTNSGVNVKTSTTKPFQQLVHKVITTPLLGIDRRKFLWVGLGGVSMVMALVSKRIFDNPPSLPIADVLSHSGTLPKLTKIQFTSVNLDSKGEIVDRPGCNVEIFTEDLGNGVALTMVKIPAGEFLMGSPTDEKYRRNDESPQHTVNLPEFYLGQVLITQAQWVAIMGNNLSKFNGNDNLPVEQVSWVEAANFCQELSDWTGRTYRLPCEAEWEYACRAGTTTPFTFGETITSEFANCDGNHSYGEAATTAARRFVGQ